MHAGSWHFAVRFGLNLKLVPAGPSKGGSATKRERL